jgi:hypothetical protein
MSRKPLDLPSAIAGRFIVTLTVEQNASDVLFCI